MKTQYLHFAAIFALFFFLIASELRPQGASDVETNVRYKEIARKIIKAAMKDSSSFETIAYMCDAFGPRLSGSKNLEDAIAWIKKEMTADGLENVREDPVMVPHWVRGEEYCELTAPRRAKINVLGLGGSVATPPGGIEAPVLVVADFNELKERKAEAKGKIVVYNAPYEHYGQSVQYRFNGAIEAALYGAAASLTRSASPFCMQNPHTGSMGYCDSVPKIPHAAISEEDAMMLGRMQKRGQKPKVKLYMEAKTLADAVSANVIGELLGREKPDEILAIGGHIDSWDAGTGAQDDASGCIATWKAVKLLKDLGLRPRRTIRAVMWTNEENGMRGAHAYADMHKHEKHALMFEMDCGAFPPHEIRYTGPDSLFKLVRAFEPALKLVEDSLIVKAGGCGVDILPMQRLGVPAMSINTQDNGTYFWFHHSHSDTIDKIDPKDLNKCVAAIAIAIYLYADLPVELIVN